MQHRVRAEGSHTRERRAPSRLQVVRTLKRPSAAPARLSLALQGGGAHGAFTWGVLDALLEDATIELDGISATSAGAMNAAVLAHGLLEGGREGAREALNRFWETVAAAAPFDATWASDAQTGALAPGLRLLMAWTRNLSPRLLNPFGYDPLREIVNAQIDFERLRAASPVDLFIAATHANTGRLRLFRERELSADTLLASACLPALQPAIEIDGEPYWDGAFAANPAVFPLFYECSAEDLLLVLLSPSQHGATPKTLDEVRSRSLDLAFNAAFLREMSAFVRAREHTARSWLPGGFDRRLRRLRFHLVEAEETVGGLDSESRMTTSLSFLQRLRDSGRAETIAWLAAHRPALGRSSTVDIARRFG